MSLIDISIAYVMVQIIVVFAALFESRFSRRTTIALCVACFILLGGGNVYLLMQLGAEKMTQIMLLTCSLPIFFFFLFLTKYRDGRFFFTFCAVDVLSLWIVGLTSLVPILNTKYDGLIMLISRVLLFLLMDFFVFGKFRQDYLKTQAVVRKGWGVFAMVAALFYVTMVIMASFPTIIRSRPAYVPGFLLFMLCVPMVLYSFVYTMLRQYEHYIAEQNARVVSVQVSAMGRQLKALEQSQYETRVLRHDLRHHIRQLGVLLQRGDSQSAVNYLSQFTQLLDETEVKRYCENPYLDAVLCYYLAMAEKQDIRVSATVAVPEDILSDEMGLAVVIANQLENAINALEKLPASERTLELSLKHIERHILLEVKNPYQGELRLDENGLPVSGADGHGLGRLSLLFYARKHQAVIDCRTANHTFILRLLVPIKEK